MKAKLYLLFFFLVFLCAGKLKAQEEKLLYSTDFQEWAKFSSNSTLPGTLVSKTTDFTEESLDVTFFKVAVDPTKTDVKFIGVTPGAAIADKAADSYIALSPLASITKVIFTHGATGNSRGYRLWKKNATDTDWVPLTSETSYANPAGGQTISVNVNEANVALKFTNLNSGQNAYLFDLKVYGNYTPQGTQHALTTNLNIPTAGIITKTPNSVEYTEGSTVSLQATSNFGYKFVKWVDANNADAELSVSNPYVVTMDAAKNIKAVFESITTYNFTVNKTGSNWGVITLSPEPVSGKYESGTEVTMTVVPNAVSTFSYWEDNSTVLQRTVTVNADVTYTATFDEIPFIVGWDFSNQTIRQDKTADYYAEGTNTGMISAYSASNSQVAWLPSAASYSPAYPAARLWTPAADFNAGNLRYLKAQFSTEGYRNIQVKSMVAASYQAYSVYKLQYSLDDISYTDVATVDISGKYNSSWSDLNATLPQEAEGKTRVYLKWVADKGSTKLDGNTGNPGSDVEGTAYTNVFIYADKEIINDTEAPILVSTVPVLNSNTATINGSIVLTFNERVKAGTGAITLGGKVLNGVFGAKTATFAYEKLSYGTQYTLNIPAGALTDQSGNIFQAYTLTFSTAERAEPVKKMFDAVVAKDGSGDYISVIDAIANAPINSVKPWVIFIKNGIYKGHHEIPANKPFIHLIGQSRDGVFITDNKSTLPVAEGGTGSNWEDGSTMYVQGANCYFENITFQNEFGYLGKQGPPALAFYTKGDRFSMKNGYLRSFQDTYYTGGSSTNRYYFLNSRIEGAVDYIYGNGNVFFDRDTLTNVRKGSVIVAPDHNSATLHGYVFRDCIINEDPSLIEKGDHRFGRPWKGTPKTVFINTKLLADINPQGWSDMGVAPEVFADYGTVDKNGNPVDMSLRKSDYYRDGNYLGTAKNFLTDQEAASYTYENVIFRSGDSWDPRLIAEAPEQPKNIKVENAVLTWDETAYTRLYVILRNNQVIGFSTTNQYADITAVQGVNYSYAIQAASEYGALSVVSETVLPISGLALSAKKTNHTVVISWSTLTEKGTSHFIIERAIDGKNFEEIGKRQAEGNSTDKQNYSFTDSHPISGDNFYRIRAVDFNGYSEYSTLVVVKFSAGGDLMIYPNPADKYISILNGKPELIINIYNSTGKKVKAIANQGNQIDVSDLSSGVYFIKTNDGNIMRFVKQ